MSRGIKICTISAWINHDQITAAMYIIIPGDPDFASSGHVRRRSTDLRICLTSFALEAEEYQSSLFQDSYSYQNFCKTVVLQRIRRKRVGEKTSPPVAKLRRLCPTDELTSTGARLPRVPHDQIIRHHVNRLHNLACHKQSHFCHNCRRQSKHECMLHP
jgi:hypothetical protein